MIPAAIGIVLVVVLCCIGLYVAVDMIVFSVRCLVDDRRHRRQLEQLRDDMDHFGGQQ